MTLPTLSPKLPYLDLATEEDWGEVLRIARTFHEFSPYKGIPFQEHKVRAIFDRYHHKPSEVVCIVARLDKKVVGAIVGWVSPLYFSDTLIASEIIWWVDEEYRGTKTGIELLHAFEFWARKVSASFIVGVNTVETTDVSKVYIRNGYHLAETTYVKELT